MTQLLPSGAGGDLTREVGYVKADVATVASWLCAGLREGWSVRSAGWSLLDDAIRELRPSTLLSRYAAIPVGNWTLILNNGPRGTDVGLLPSQAARELGCCAVRAVCVEDDDQGFPARILEVFGPDGAGPLRRVRSIAAAKDGRKWVFETSGEPFEFERTEQYTRRRKSDRFPSALLYEYLRQLDVPIDREPRWTEACMIDRSST